MSVIWSEPKPYFELRNGQLTLENVPVPTPSKESGLLILLEHSQLVHSVMKRLAPTWWLDRTVQVQNTDKAVKVACVVLHQLEELTTSRGSRLIVVVQRIDDETEFRSLAVDGAKGVLSCLSDPATRVLDLKPALSELKASEPSKYNKFYIKHYGHMTAEGNHFVALQVSKLLPQQ